MTAGLPGTGIGGIFYLLITFMMPFHELVCMIRGQGSWNRWRVILLQLANASGVMLSLAGGAWFIRRLTDLWPLSSESLVRVQAVTAVTFAWIAMTALGTVVLLVLILRGILLMSDRLKAIREQR